VVELDGLENRCTRKGTEGSNPSLSAKIKHPTSAGYFILAQGRDPNGLAPREAKAESPTSSSLFPCPLSPLSSRLTIHSWAHRFFVPQRVSPLRFAAAASGL
jgi:hypothetical protein